MNERLGELLARRQPPQAAGREVKLNYATQVSVAPPTIAVFGNHPDLVEEHYVRFLHNGFRESWRFTGNPLRMLMRRKSGGSGRASHAPGRRARAGVPLRVDPVRGHRRASCEGVDLRKHGSGNLGATNVFRVLGWKIGVAVFLADALKGALPVLCFRRASTVARDPVVWAHRSAASRRSRDTCGRSSSDFGKGGKGVATAAGVFFALAPIPMLVTFAVFVGVVLAHRLRLARQPDLGGACFPRLLASHARLRARRCSS